MPEMRKCKECGKMFQPKGREQYCSNDHYRPCPICGAEVLVKYLSDPPRKCDNCRGKKIQPAAKKSESTLLKTKSLFKIEPKDFTMKPSSFTVKPMTTAKAKEPTKPTVKNESKVDKQDWKELIDPIPQTVGDRGMFIEAENQSIRMYIGIDIENGFIPGHQYLVNVSHDGYGYMVVSKDDLTTGEIVKVGRVFSSQISYAQNFAKVKING